MNRKLEKPKIKIYDRTETLVAVMYDQLREIFSAQPAYGESWHIVLSGGSTPRAFYDFLAKRPAGEINWQHIHFWWGDERCVPPDHADSNYRMVRETLLDQINISAGNLHRIRGESVPEREALRYGEEIGEYVPLATNGLPVFDLILLGLGEDGHTASIFPGTDLADNTDSRCAVALHPQSGQKRITLTLPLLNQARHIVFMVTGSAKAEMVSSIIREPDLNKRFPAARVVPTDGEIFWFIDRDAAAHLQV